MTNIPFVTLADPVYGQAVQVSPLIRRVIAHNPSKYTYLGTGTYIIGSGDVAVIDPGPMLDTHYEALMSALAGEQVRAIVVTHCHADHSPLAARLRADTGAPTVAIGPHGVVDDDTEADTDDTADDTDEPEAASEVDPSQSPTKVEESIDGDFAPDITVVDGDLVAQGPGWTLRAVHTPGHTSNHLCVSLDEEQALFTGDHVMGWSTTVVAPPDGDMRAYVDSLRRVAGRQDRTLWPTHGAPVAEPRPFVEALVEHRREREAQILAAIRSGIDNIPAIVALLYANVRVELHKPAARSVLAHLVALVDDGQVTADSGAPRLRSRYAG